MIFNFIVALFHEVFNVDTLSQNVRKNPDTFFGFIICLTFFPNLTEIV